MGGRVIKYQFFPKFKIVNIILGGGGSRKLWNFPKVLDIFRQRACLHTRVCEWVSEWVSLWVSGWVDQKLFVRRPGWTRGGLANTDSLYRKDYTQTVGKVQSGIKWNYWHERRRCSPSQLGNDWQWRIYSSLQYGHCGQSWLSSTTLRLNSVFRQRACLHMGLCEWVSEWVRGQPIFLIG